MVVSCSVLTHYRASVLSGSDMSLADDTYDEKVNYQGEMDEYDRIRGE